MCCGSWWGRREDWSAEHRLGMLGSRFSTRRDGARRSHCMHPKTKRECLRDMVTEKNRWSERQLSGEEEALGFPGWHERGYVPHSDFRNLVQFVTFRLEDSMPASRRGEWEQLLKIENVRERRRKLEEYPDREAGGCVLQQKAVVRVVEDTLLHFHKDRYELPAWCV